MQVTVTANDELQTYINNLIDKKVAKWYTKVEMTTEGLRWRNEEWKRTGVEEVDERNLQQFIKTIITI